MKHGEKFNSITHITGAALALAGGIILIVSAAINGNPWLIVGVSIYSFTLLFLYVTSSLFHSLDGRAKKIFHKMDHIAIYLLIAGTYTPFALVTLHGMWGWIILGMIWGLAVVGIVLDFFSDAHGKRTIQLILYLLMGWLVIVAYRPMLSRFPRDGLWLLLAGGVFYSMGIIFFVFDKKIRHFHGIWHLFVLAGSVTHYFSIYYYIK